MTVATFSKGGVDYVTIVPSSLLPKKKEKNQIWNFSLCKCVVGYNVRWVRGGGTKGTYSYSEGLIVGSWFTHNIEEVGE